MLRKTGISLYHISLRKVTRTFQNYDNCEAECHDGCVPPSTRQRVLRSLDAGVVILSQPPDRGTAG